MSAEVDLRLLVSEMADLLAFYAKDAHDERVQRVLVKAFEAHAWEPMTREAADRMFAIVGRDRLRSALEGKRPTVPKRRGAR